MVPTKLSALALYTSTLCKEKVKKEFKSYSYPR